MINTGHIIILYDWSHNYSIYIFIYKQYKTKCLYIRHLSNITKTLYKCKQYKTECLYIKHLSNITKTLYKCTWHEL